MAMTKKMMVMTTICHYHLDPPSTRAFLLLHSSDYFSRNLPAEELPFQGYALGGGGAEHHTHRRLPVEEKWIQWLDGRTCKW